MSDENTETSDKQEEEDVENRTRMEEMKKEAQDELKEIERHLSQIDDIKNDSIKKLEDKKRELRRFSEIQAIREQHTKALEEMMVAKEEITARKLSIALMDQTITNLDEYANFLLIKNDHFF